MFNGSLFGRSRQATLALIVSLVVFLLPGSSGQFRVQAQTPTTYTNPITSTTGGGGKLVDVQSCAQPSIIHSQTSGDTNWYLYCTTDPLNDKDTNPDGSLKTHLIPMLSSPDLVNWTYQADAFSTQPSWVKPGACLIAPDIHFFNGQYYLYYTACDTVAGGSAVGVATSTSPIGPWTDSGSPVVEPHEAYCCAGSRRPMDNASVIDDNGQKYIFFGHEFGGITVRKLSADGLHSDPATANLVVLDNKYEGAFVWPHGGYWYIFVSAGGCCSGALSGYSVYVGRSKDPNGPYVDQNGVSLLDGRVGGTPVLSMNGNRWVGVGANSVFTDMGGQDWVVYEGIDRNDPYFTGTTWNKRPALMDPLDWINGWPQVRGGNWASDTAMPVPAAQAGQKTAYTVTVATADKPGSKVKKLSDDFTEKKLNTKQWTWIRNPGKARAYLSGKKFNFVGCDCDLYQTTNNAPVLTENTPSGNYLVEAKVDTGVPGAGCCYNYIQTGLVIYKDDDNFIKLVHDSVWNTRQTEFAKEIPTGPLYGSTLVGPPGQWTWLRIVKTASGSEELYRAYTSQDGKKWVRGGVWTHTLGAGAKIGIVSMGGAALNKIKYVHVYNLK